MTLVRSLLAFSVIALFAGCGGPDESATVPRAQPADATSADIGDYVVHFSAQTTDHLSPEVARAYDILRSPSRAMLNISVIRKSSNTSVAATVTVSARNLTGQLKNVSMRKIEEPGETVAIYYIGETPVANRETLVFDIRVTPAGESGASEVRFKREFFTDVT